MPFAAVVARIERGVMRKFPPAAVIALNSLVHQRFGEPELYELDRLVRPGTLAVDVGAHFGVYSLALARLVGKQGRVLSVEPIEEDALMLERAARTLRLPINVVHCALSSVSGEAELHVPLLGGAQKTALSHLSPAGSHGQVGQAASRSVRTRRLDDLLAAVDVPVSFIKIDVEGHELEVLAGAEQTLREQRPNLLIEINHDAAGSSMADVLARVCAYGYRGEFLEEGRFRRPLSAFDVDRHQVAASGNVLSNAYVNNFIFIPE